MATSSALISTDGIINRPSHCSVRRKAADHGTGFRRLPLGGIDRRRGCERHRRASRSTQWMAITWNSMGNEREVADLAAAVGVKRTGRSCCWWWWWWWWSAQKLPLRKTLRRKYSRGRPAEAAAAADDADVATPADRAAQGSAPLHVRTAVMCASNFRFEATFHLIAVAHKKRPRIGQPRERERERDRESGFGQSIETLIGRRRIIECSRVGGVIWPDRLNISRDR